MQFDAFAYVYLLGLLPVMLALYAYGFWRQRRTLAAFVERPLAARLLPRMHRGRRWVKALCVVGAVACLVVALMQPQWGETEEEVPRRGRDLVIVLDLSLSMLAEDVRRTAWSTPRAWCASWSRRCAPKAGTGSPW